MELILILESKKIDDRMSLPTISKNPCNYCLLGSGPMCVERKYCRWDSHGEIFIKKYVFESEKTKMTTPNMAFQPIENYDFERNHKVIVTNNINGKDVNGQMSHIWIVESIQRNKHDGFFAFTEFGGKIMGVTHFCELP